jgi:hypothetical protein
MRQVNGCAAPGLREMASRVAEQDGLLRVARRVAGGAAMAGLVAAEVARLLDVEAGIVWRFDDDGSVVVGAHGDHGSAPGVSSP